MDSAWEQEKLEAALNERFDKMNAEGREDESILGFRIPTEVETQHHGYDGKELFADPVFRWDIVQRGANDEECEPAYDGESNECADHIVEVQFAEPLPYGSLAIKESLEIKYKFLPIVQKLGVAIGKDDHIAEIFLHPAFFGVGGIVCKSFELGVH